VPERLAATENRCACGHLRPDHDAVSLRYCAAIAADAARTGCICTPAGGLPTDRLYESHRRT
jgi:hypothetical protein